MQIGFIGVGMMGLGMALNLLKVGHDVVAIAHRNRAPINELVRNGAKEAPDLERVAAESEIIILCLSTAEVVSETVGRLRPHLRSGQIIIDTGTTAPETTKRLAQDLGTLGIA